MPRIVDGVWSWLNTNAGAVSTVATVITALVAVLALRATARDSRDRARAYVALDPVPATRSRSSAVLRVRNFGQSVARDVQLTFTPPLSPHALNDTVAPVERRYRDAIPDLSPGQELKNTWQTWTDNGTLSSAPERCAVRVTHRSGRTRQCLFVRAVRPRHQGDRRRVRPDRIGLRAGDDAADRDEPQVRRARRSMTRKHADTLEFCSFGIAIVGSPEMTALTLGEGGGLSTYCAIHAPSCG